MSETLTNPLKDSIEPTEENVKLALTELQKLGWIRGWWTYRSFYSIDHGTGEPSVVKGPEQAAIWIDGFGTGKGGLANA